MAIGAAVYVATGSGNGAPDGWSGWKPTTDDGEKAAKQIATHVGREYRLADGSQIVGVQGGPLEIDALGLTVPLSIAMKTAPQGGDIDFIDGKGLLYTLNGLGPKGSVRGGKPSEQRLLLLRREALELALYTFRYISDVDEVVALLPPAPPDKPKDEEGRGRRDHDDRQADAGAVLPPRRPPAAARDPARRDDPAADPAPGDDPGPRGPPHRRAHAREPVPRLLPAGAGPEGLPRAGPPAAVAGAAEHRQPRVLRVLGLGLRALAERERRAAGGVHELLVHAAVAESGGLPVCHG